MAINNDAKVHVISTRSPYAVNVTFIRPMHVSFYKLAFNALLLEFAFYANCDSAPFWSTFL